MARSRQQGRKRKQKKQNENGGEGKQEYHQDKRDDKRDDSRREDSYKLSVQSSAKFEEYYKVQKIVPEEEWDQFMATLRDKLPSTFRITGYKRESAELLNIIKSDYFNTVFSSHDSDKDSDNVLQPPKCLTWYPDELAWQINVDKKFIRHSETVKKLHQFLVQETESGNISRQEAVSMIPPLLLDIQPHHKVLDMCAAPGSKTAQLIEMLHADESQPIPEGFVMANDSDNKRCYLMVHQVKRLESPNFMVVNHDASQMPKLFLTEKGAGESETLSFDRILADVPCTGDGTMRKNPDVWQKWKPTNGYNLHCIQTRILDRGLALLECGGRLVYSTCSFNPVENEAVVGNALLKSQGALELVDVSDKLPGLRVMPGLQSWKLQAQKTSDWYETWQDVPAHSHSFIRNTMFPPTEEQAAQLHLHRCVRVLPHHQDTGGFFIAVLQKNREVPWESQKQGKRDRSKVSADKPVKSMDTTPSEEQTKEQTSSDQTKEQTSSEQTTELTSPEQTKEQTSSEQTKEQTSSEQTEQTKDTVAPPSEGQVQQNAGASQKRKETETASSFPPGKKQKLRGFKEDPFIFLEETDPVWSVTRDFFGLSESFPISQTLVRCSTGKKRNIYFTSSIVKKIVECNEGRLKVVNLGLKILSRSVSPHVPCDFRLVQEGVSTLFPYLSKRIIQISKDDIVTLLTQENPFVDRLSSSAKEKLDAVDQGGCAFLYQPEQGDDGPQCKLVICGWKGKVSCRSFMPKNDRAHYLRLCGAELKTKEQILMEKAEKAEAAATAKEDSPSEMMPDSTAAVEDSSMAESESVDTLEDVVTSAVSKERQLSEDKETVDQADSNTTVDSMNVDL